MTAASLRPSLGPIAVSLLVAATLLVWPAVPQAQTVRVSGAGATFPYPLYSSWFAAYRQVVPAVELTYLSVGSGAGIQQLMEEMVFFGATDTPMTEEEIQEARGRILHLPAAIGAVAPIYNLPGVTGEVKFTGAILADIFLGRITNWNDPVLAGINKDLKLPPVEITVVSRAESSGTSFIWCDFLSKMSPDWKRLIGPNRAPVLPVGISARGSEGVSAQIKQTPGAIGYVELAYAVRNEVAMGAVQNAHGEFVRPSIASMTAAAAAAVGKMPRDFRVSITNAPGAGVYPISSFTWMLLYANPRDKQRSRHMVDFMKWALTDGQALAPELGYGPLPAAIVDLEMAALGKIKVS